MRFEDQNIRFPAFLVSVVTYQGGSKIEILDCIDYCTRNVTWNESALSVLPFIIIDAIDAQHNTFVEVVDIDLVKTKDQSRSL